MAKLRKEVQIAKSALEASQVAAKKASADLAAATAAADAAAAAKAAADKVRCCATWGKRTLPVCHMGYTHALFVAIWTRP